MARMRYEKAQRNKTATWVFSGNDQVYGNYIPDMTKSEEVRKMEMHPEIKKLIYSTKPETNEYNIEVNNEREA